MTQPRRIPCLAALAALVMLLLMSVPLSAAAAGERGDTQQLKTFFQVTIRQGPSAGLVANGVLTLEIQTGTGNFTGTLTPAEAEGTGEPQSSVLFHEVNHKLVAFGDVKEIDVRGTIHGHAISLVALNAGGESKDIFGVGTTEIAFGEPSAEQGLGQIAGPAVGPQEGDSGDWIVSLHPIVFRLPPIINSPSTTTFLEFTANSFTVTTSGVPIPSFSETGTLPKGVTFSAGVLSGNPTQLGTFPITITASNGVPPDAVQTFTLVVNRPPPTFTSPLSPTPVVVGAYSFGIATGCSPSAGRACPQDFAITVTSADNPGTFSTFLSNATAAASSGQRFNATLAFGDVAAYSFGQMVVANVTTGGSSGNAAVSITLAFTSVTILAP